MNCIRKNIAAMAGYVPGEQPRDRQYIKLNTNENPYPPSPQVAKALGNLVCGRLRLYPDPAATRLREEAASVAGVPDSGWVLCGNGSDDLLTIAVRTFVDQGGMLASFDPSYSLYPVLAEIQGAGACMIPLDADFAMPGNAAELAGMATLLFLARPNAPTGNSFPREKVRELCRDFRGIVWIDEAYADFAEDNCLGLLAEFANVIVSRTLSKSYSLAGARLGIAFANPELITQMMKVKDSYNVGMLTQVVGTAALSDQDYMLVNAGRIRNSRETVSGHLREMGFMVLPSQANFIFCRPPMPASEYFAALRAEGVLVRYFSGERTGDYVRITIGTPDEMAALVAATRRILGR